jgi:hypothetical protein
LAIHKSPCDIPEILNPFAQPETEMFPAGKASGSAFPDDVEKP